MDELIIHYRGGDGTISERRISDLEASEPDNLIAYCHLRQAVRTFKVSRIQCAIDPASGEVITDLAARLGMTPKASESTPNRDVPAMPLPTGEDLRRLRTKEKRALWNRFMFPAIELFFKQRLFTLFENRCFKCGSEEKLHVDHHIPAALGGHLVPGNLVVLCDWCNARKHDSPPEEFYRPAELEALHPLLQEEAGIFDFKFDREHWRMDRKGYLLQIGLDLELVEAILTDPRHPMFIEPPTEITFRLSLDPNSGGEKA